MHEIVLASGIGGTISALGLTPHELIALAGVVVAALGLLATLVLGVSNLVLAIRADRREERRLAQQSPPKAPTVIVAVEIAQSQPGSLPRAIGLCRRLRGRR
jgi:hypothetical protein